MEEVFKIFVDMGIDQTQAIIVYKILDTVQMIIFLIFLGIAARWIVKKIQEDD